MKRSAKCPKPPEGIQIMTDSVFATGDMLFVEKIVAAQLSLCPQIAKHEIVAYK